MAARQDAVPMNPPTEPQDADPQLGPGTPLSPTDARPIEFPATFHANGLPTFRYNLPTVPLATIEIDTGVAMVSADFGMRGNVSVTFEDPEKWVSVDQNGLRLEATHALGGLTEGLRISGLGSKAPSIGATVGSVYETTEGRFTPPNTLTFIGQTKISYSVNSPVGRISVQGQPGFELRVTVTPLTPPPMEPQTSEEFGHSESYGGLPTLGLLALIALAITTAPETGGGSLVLLGI